MNRASGRDIIMLIAGGYLIYLGIKIIQTGIIEGAIGDKWRWLGLVCAIAFIVFGAGELILRIRKLFMIQTNVQTEEALENAEADSEESPVESPEEVMAETEEEQSRRRSIQELIAENSVDDSSEDEAVDEE